MTTKRSLAYYVLLGAGLFLIGAYSRFWAWARKHGRSEAT
jgi:hypothetical protein